MLKRCKTLAIVVCLMFVGSMIVEDAFAQRRGSSRSSRPSSSRPSSSRPSSSSKPKFGSSSKPKTGSSTSKPKFGSGGSKPSTGSSRPATGSRKPTTGSTSSKARANQQAASKRKYETTSKATAPAKTSYTNSKGKSVKVRKDSAAVTRMRSRPSSYYTPAARTTRHTTYITSHNYSHGYGWYHSQPYYSMGGGYSSAYWYMMMEWSAQRRATWLYNNQSNISSTAYQKGMQDAEVQQRLAALEAGGTARNGDYVDPEMADNPGMQYSQDYVEAAYNPTVVASGGGSAAGTVFVWMLVIVFGFVAVWFVSTRLKFGS